MGEASEMSSVQSAWEDLVVENPNRAKLEACLLTTIMLVVLCIFALLTYVYVQLQPAGNVVMRPLFWKTSFEDTFADRQFAHRMLGWMNWSSTRCLGFSEWACGGRLIEASSQAVYETAEMAAEDYAKEYAIELMDRNDAFYTSAPTSDFTALNDSAFGVQDNSFKMLTQFFRSCRTGYSTIADFMAAYRATFGLMFVQNSESGQVWDRFKAMQRNFSIFPLGDMYLTTPADNDSKLTSGEFITVEPVRLIARPHDKNNPKYTKVFRDGFASINSAIGGCCGDNGESVSRHEVKILEELEQETAEELELGLPFAPRARGALVDMCPALNTLSTTAEPQCRYRKRRIAEAVKELAARGADAINWAVLKLFILLSPMMPANEDKLKDFFKLVAWYHRRAEMPHKDLLCMNIAEKYFPHALEALFAKDSFLNATKVEMVEALKKLDAPLQAPGQPSTGGQSTVFTTQLFGPRSAFDAKLRRSSSDNITKAWTAGYDRIIFFGPPDSHRPNAPGGNTTDPMQLIIMSIPTGPSEPKRWLGSRFSGEPLYDIRKDRIYAPLGLAMPPYYHADSGKIKHSAPAYLTKLCKALVERFVKQIYKPPGARGGSPRQAESPVILPPAEATKITDRITKDVTCFRNEVSSHLMWDLYFTRSGITLAYQIWRRGFNHASINADTQLRIKGLKFMSEEMLFFVTAANGICQVANPAFASGIDVRNAPKVVNTVVHCPLLGDTMLCDKSRPVFESKCGGLFPPITRGDEALFTVEAWRQSRRVQWSA